MASGADTQTHIDTHTHMHPHRSDFKKPDLKISLNNPREIDHLIEIQAMAT